MKNFGKNSDILLGFGLILMLGLMLIPLPPLVLDFLLSLNITLAVLVLIVSLYIQSPLDISVFPGLLLVTTLFRLGLNISSTRLILIEGYAGKVIESFGSFVVGGNYVVGFIVFLILVVIQFIVIVKGSGRISEVAARFTLDAM
ncbi:MAG: FHIPEP family type III secretion protein, partial [Bacteroidota bacterium]